MPQLGQISWRAVGLTARAVKAATYPNSRRRRQDGTSKRVGLVQGGKVPLPARPDNPAVQVGTTLDVYPGTGGTTNWSQEKKHVSARYPQERAEPTPYQGWKCWCCPPNKAKEGKQVSREGTGNGEDSTRRTPGSTGGEAKAEPPTRNETVDVSLGELGRQVLLDPQKWKELLGRQCPQDGTKEESGEGKRTTAKEQEKKGEKKNQEKGEPGEGNGGPPGKPPGDEGEKKREGTFTRNLDYAPVCCSCNRQGVEQIKFREDVKSDGELTFCTRIIREGSTTRLGVCLMASNTGLITTSRGKLCGHVVCPHCLVTKQGQAMCPCCSRKLESQGASKGGAGPLPKKDPPSTKEKVKKEPQDSEDGRGRRERAERKRRRESSTDSRAPRARRDTGRSSEGEEPASDEEERDSAGEGASGSGMHRRHRGPRNRKRLPGKKRTPKWKKLKRRVPNVSSLVATDGRNLATTRAVNRARQAGERGTARCATEVTRETLHPAGEMDVTMKERTGTRDTGEKGKERVRKAERAGRTPHKRVGTGTAGTKGVGETGKGEDPGMRNPYATACSSGP